MSGFINNKAFKCLLGPQSKDVIEHDSIYSWKVGKKQHFTTDRILSISDIEYLQSIAPSNFHYLLQDNIDFLKNHFTVDKVKHKSIILDIENLNLSGSKMKSLRQSVNKCSKNEFEILDNFKDLKDVKDLIEEWSNEYTDKYFRDFSGKNFYFYKNNFHEGCINVFVYSEDRLVSFGTLSPNDDGNCSYIIGKALFKRFYGLSEYTDITLYRKAAEHGIKSVNMGQASKGLMFYKSKFPNAVEQIHYDGKIIQGDPV